MKALLYCTKGKPYIAYQDIDYDCDDTCCSFNGFLPFTRQELYDYDISLDKTLNGKIVAKCDIDLITKNDLVFDRGFNEETQLSLRDIGNYVGDKEYYCLHLSNIEVFDNPKELSEYCVYTYPTFDKNNTLEKAPQNMCRVLTKNGYPYILISIQPQWLCKILNGEKTVEVRRKIISPLKNLIGS